MILKNSNKDENSMNDTTTQNLLHLTDYFKLVQNQAPFSIVQQRITNKSEQFTIFKDQDQDDNIKLVYQKEPKSNNLLKIKNVQQVMKCNCSPQPTCRNFLRVLYFEQWLYSRNIKKEDFKENQFETLYLQTIDLKSQYECQKEYQFKDEQILKDVQRLQYLQESENIRQILETFKKIYQDVGYIQGMSHLVSILKYHGEDWAVFSLMAKLNDEFQMSDVWKLKSLEKHSQIVEFLLMKANKKISVHFQRQNISIQVIIVPWFITLFTSVIPKDKFFDQFFEHGWNFVYQLCIQIFYQFEQQILQSDRFEIYKIFSQTQFNDRNEIFFDWKLIIERALLLQIDTNFIYLFIQQFEKSQKYRQLLWK